MPWNGAGTYSLPGAYSPEVNGTTIDAARYNGLTNDVATGITAALAKNGENVPTANLPMGGFKHTGAADGAAAGQYMTWGNATGKLGNLDITANTVPANGLYLPSANTLGFATNTTARGSINSTGNWAISAPSSGTPLTVTSASGGASMRLTDGTVIFDITHAAAQFSMGTAGAHQINMSTNGVNRFVIGASGNVTVSAPSSGTALSITGLANNPSIYSTDGNVTAYPFGFTGTGASAQGYTGTVSSHDFTLLSANTARVTVGKTGNVTIAAPSSGIATTINASGSTAALQLNATAANSATLQFAPNGGSSVFSLLGGADTNAYISSTNTLYIGTNSATRITVGTSGNVTIAAPSSGVGLTVAGGGLAVTGNSTITGTLGGLTGLTVASGGASITGNSTITGTLGGVTTLTATTLTGTLSTAAQTNVTSVGTLTSLAVSGNTTLGDALGDTLDVANGAFKVYSDGRISGNKLHNIGTVTGTTDQFIASGTYTPTLSNTTNISSSTAYTCQWLRVGNVVTVSGKVLPTATAGGSIVLGISLPIASNFTAAEQLGGAAGYAGGAGGSITGDTVNDRATLGYSVGGAGAIELTFSFTYLVA